MNERDRELELSHVATLVAELMEDWCGDAFCDQPQLDQSLRDYFVTEFGCDDREAAKAMAEMCRRLEVIFAVPIAKELAATWFGVAQASDSKARFDCDDDLPDETRNFRGLCEWVLRHRLAVTARPLNVAGRECRPAGIFLRLRELTEELEGTSVRIAPSTRLRDQFKDPLALWQFWRVLTLATQSRLPELPSRSALGCWGVMLAGFVVLILAIAEKYAAALVVVVTTFEPAMALFRIDRLKYELTPMPLGLETFGDLARFLDRSMQLEMQVA